MISEGFPGLPPRLSLAVRISSSLQYGGAFGLIFESMRIKKSESGKE